MSVIASSFVVPYEVPFACAVRKSAFHKGMETSAYGTVSDIRRANHFLWGGTGVREGVSQFPQYPPRHAGYLTVG
jgi:hypothetical protein